MRSKKSINVSTTKQWLTPLLLLSVVNLLTSCGTGSGADPGIEEFPIAYIKRAILVDNQGDMVQPDIRSPLDSTPGGDLYIKPRASLSSPEINITGSITNGIGDVKDLDVSSDGKLLIFSMLAADPNPNDDSDDPTWDIYTYNRETNELSRVIPKLSDADIIARLGDDIAPYFLPSNRIIFSSNRQKQSRAILSTESAGKPQFSSQDEDNGEKALVLHTMNLDGTDIRQISFNQSHDLDPTVLQNGRILFSRWDNMNRNGTISLFTILQDGSDLQPYYGTHDNSHEVIGALDEDGNTPQIQFIQPRELLDGRIMMLQRPFSDSFAGGEIFTVNAQNFIDLNQPTSNNAITMAGLSASQKVSTNSLSYDGSIDYEGRYSSFYPLNDDTDRILVSKGLCQIDIDTNTDPNVDPVLEPFLCLSEEAQLILNDPANTTTETYPAYGIWLYNPSEQTEKPIVKAESGMFITEAVVMRPYDRALINQGGQELNSSLISENVGLLNIRSVYDFGNSTFDGCFFTECTDANVSSVLELGDPTLATADQRPARFIRLVKAVGLPNRNDPDLANPPNLSGNAFSRARRLGMREIIGYSMIQPDGSVQVKVPANIAFYFEILDKAGRRIGPRHENWLQVNAGSTVSCNGCHTHATTGNAQPLPHARKDAIAPSINTTEPTTVNGVYPNTLIPYVAGSFNSMAEALNAAQGKAGATPSVNIEYTDEWTDPAFATPSASFTYAYTGIATPNFFTLNAQNASPYSATSTCESQWEARCRTIINYQDHIQPIWDYTPRIDSVSAAVVTCTNCHTTLNNTIVPAAQLDLMSNTSDEEPQHIESFRELFFNDVFQDIVGNALIDILIDALDENGDPIRIPDPNLPQPVAAMSVNGARASFFMEKMTETELDAGRALPTPTVNHANMLTPAELKLIAEYLDIGGQYFNNPFDPDAPPQN